MGRKLKMKWTDLTTGGRLSAKLGDTLNITLITKEEPKRNSNGSYSVKLVSGHIAVFEKPFTAANLEHAQERAVTEVRNYIEGRIRQYQTWAEQLERADAKY